MWTSLRDVEGFGYDKTMNELRALYPVEADDERMEDADAILPHSVPEPIREMADSKEAMEALGSMIWYVKQCEVFCCPEPHDAYRYLRQLNIDKDILSMRNFNVYDPMKRGQGLTLDGQTLAHVEVRGLLLIRSLTDSFVSRRCCSITRVLKKARYCSY